MKARDALAPIHRKRKLFWSLFLILSAVFIAAIQFAPKTEQTLIYFSVKATGDPTAGNHHRATEGAEFMADAIAGWVKNPSFRETIATKAGVVIPKLKNKLTARKQNRVNVFYTLKLNKKTEAQHAVVMTDSILETIRETFATYNESAAFQFEMTEPTVARELKTIPLSWGILIAFFLGFVIAVLIIYGRESLSGRISFIEEIEERFPYAPMLRIQTPPGQHEADMLDSFLASFVEPHMIGGFAQAEDIFNVTDLRAITSDEATPIILVKMGETTIADLNNFEAIFGERIVFVIFER